MFEKIKGLRKFLGYVLGLISFTIIVIYLGIQSADVIIALGLSIAGMNTPFVFGNVAENKAKIAKTPQTPE